jgi:hypothetical protein
LKENHNNKVNPNGIKLPRKATHLISFFSPLGRKSMTKATSVGENKISVSKLLVTKSIVHS